MFCILAFFLSFFLSFFLHDDLSLWLLKIGCVEAFYADMKRSRKKGLGYYNSRYTVATLFLYVLRTPVVRRIQPHLMAGHQIPEYWPEINIRGQIFCETELPRNVFNPCMPTLA